MLFPICIRIGRAVFIAPYLVAKILRLGVLGFVPLLELCYGNSVPIAGDTQIFWASSRQCAVVWFGFLCLMNSVWAVAGVWRGGDSEIRRGMWEIFLFVPFGCWIWVIRVNIKARREDSLSKRLMGLL